MNELSQFQDPPHDFSVAAFWFWNGTLEPDKLEYQIKEMIDKGVFEAFMHARAYLKTPYLEEEWWKAVGRCVEKGAELGFHPWIYDEYAWPSGTAGSTFDYGFQKPSRVLAQGEKNMAKGLRPVKAEAPANIPLAEIFTNESSPLAVFAADYSDPVLSFHPVANWRSAAFNKPKTVMAFYREIYSKYVDYLNPETIRLFIDLTHEEYKKRYKDSLGTVIPGVFFDEIYNTAPVLPWTDNFAKEFEKRKGYDILACLPYLVEEGDKKAKRIRKDYYGVVAQLYEEAFFAQIGDWCEENGLMLTGHTEEGLSQHPRRQGNYFSTMRHLQIPGSDCHDYRYRFPREITFVEPKYSVSVARLYGKKRCMSEAMGGAGWGCSLQQFKRGINTMGAMGISLFVLHGFYYECDTQGSQADWPTSFFYQNPYWKYFKYFSNYIRRICYMNTLGKPVVDVGIWYPIEEIQANTVAGQPNAAANAISDGFHRVLNRLINRQIDADMVDSESILRGEIRDGGLCVGDEHFRVLLFPLEAELGGKLTQKLSTFCESGGKILKYVCFEEKANASKRSAFSPEEIPEALDEVLQPDILVEAGSRGNLCVSHRTNDGEHLYFVSNSSSKKRSITLLLREKGKVRKLNPETGLTEDISWNAASNGTQVSLDLIEDEACWLCVGESGNARSPAWRTEETIAVARRWGFLPLNGSYADRWGVDAKETELSIPVAMLRDSLHEEAFSIRICNRQGEPGRIGRHISLWKAAWITRRPSWNDDSAKENLYFRKRFTLSGIPGKAVFCIAAINEFELYINGKTAGNFSSNGNPILVSVSGLLAEGENLVAVHVHNSTPLHDVNICSVEEIPKNCMISLLLQASIHTDQNTIELQSDNSWIVNDKEEESWILPKKIKEESAKKADPTQFPSFGGGEKDGVWLFAWERGKPPILPWGDVPLWGDSLSYPVCVAYTVVLPAGTVRLRKPVVQGERQFLLDGMPLNFENEFCPISISREPRCLTIQVTAHSADDGLKSPVEITVSPVTAPLSDWRLLGLSWFSGYARYSSTVNIGTKKEGRYLLNLGSVHFQAEIWVNGVLAGVRVWEPYELDITQPLCNGENRLDIVVSNSAAVERRQMLVDEGAALGWNRYWNEDNIEREGENLCSGLLGPIQIKHQIPEEKNK